MSFDENPMDSVTISGAIYAEMCDACKKLTALEVAGVDNWEGYDDALREL